MNILAITQARIGSTRLPEKILKEINGETLLEIHLKRILQSKLITKVKVATTLESDTNKILDICKKLNIDFYQGSLNNVLERFYLTALQESPDWIVRLTSDCPLIDAAVIDKVIQHAVSNNLDYVSNTLKPTFPDGIDVEVFKFVVLERAYREAELKSDLEHVTPYIWKNSSFNGGNLFTSDCIMNESDFSGVRLTVDTIEDFQLVEWLIKISGLNESWLNYVKVLQANPDIMRKNAHFKRNEGYLKSLNFDKK